MDDAASGKLIAKSVDMECVDGGLLAGIWLSLQIGTRLEHRGEQGAPAHAFPHHSLPQDLEVRLASPHSQLGMTVERNP